MTGYPDITYERLNATAALTRSLTWLRCLTAAISRLDPVTWYRARKGNGTPVFVARRAECYGFNCAERL